ncbi:hypothetical protein D3C77_806240 [compost metagenome]
MIEFFMAATGLVASILIVLVVGILPIACYRLQSARLELMRLLWDDFHRRYGKDADHD